MDRFAPRNSFGIGNKIRKERKMVIKRRVVIVFGKWGKITDFVLEPTCTLKCVCEVCKDAIWIEECLHIGGKTKW